jgi:cell division protein FtsW
MKKYFAYLQGDTVIWVITMLFLATSIVSVYSFVPILIKTEGGTPTSYLMKHTFYILLGFFAMYWVHKQDPKYIGKLSLFLLLFSIALMIFTFFFGVRINDASRWVRVPIIGLTFQSSDLAKFALVVYSARQLVVREPFFDNWKQVLLHLGVPLFLICALIAKDNFSTAVILFTVCYLMFFIGRVPFTKLFGLLGIGGILGGLVILLNLTFPALGILPRWETWMNRFFRAYGEETETIANAQAMNAELAIHNGGYFGVGIGDGKLKQFIPEAYADFYFASFVEEFGLLMAFILIFLYSILFYRILRIGLNAEKLFETYVCIGIGLLILSQAIVNMMVCTRIIPVTGQNMPLLAMGGSAMIMSCISLGVVLSIARKKNPKGIVTDENNTKTV